MTSKCYAKDVWHGDTYILKTKDGVCGHYNTFERVVWLSFVDDNERGFVYRRLKGAFKDIKEAKEAANNIPDELYSKLYFKKE